MLQEQLEAGSEASEAHPRLMQLLAIMLNPAVFSCQTATPISRAEAMILFVGCA
jgi:hypothetical protein